MQYPYTPEYYWRAAGIQNLINWRATAIRYHNITRIIEIK